MSELLALLREEVGIPRHSEWLLIDQKMIDGFADVTIDHQYIHVDPERAAKSPFGGPIAHGFLTLSLLSRLAETTIRPAMPQVRMAINYGFDRIRFINPVPVGSRVRSTATLISVEEKRPGQIQQRSDLLVEIEGSDQPALTAIWLSQLFT